MMPRLLHFKKKRGVEVQEELGIKINHPLQYPIEFIVPQVSGLPRAAVVSPSQGNFQLLGFLGMRGPGPIYTPTTVAGVGQQLLNDAALHLQLHVLGKHVSATNVLPPCYRHGSLRQRMVPHDPHPVVHTQSMPPTISPQEYDHAVHLPPWGWAHQLPARHQESIRSRESLSHQQAALGLSSPCSIGGKSWGAPTSTTTMMKLNWEPAVEPFTMRAADNRTHPPTAGRALNVGPRAGPSQDDLKISSRPGGSQKLGHACSIVSNLTTPASVTSEDSMHGQARLNGKVTKTSRSSHAVGIMAREEKRISEVIAPSMRTAIAGSTKGYNIDPCPRDRAAAPPSKVACIRGKKGAGVPPSADVLAPRSLPGLEAGPSKLFAATVLYQEGLDDEYLTAYQCELRKHLEVFEAGPNEVRASASPGRTGLVKLGQVGLRCRHCAATSSPHLATRTRGAAYYSQTVSGMYQLAQNMTKGHLSQRCYYIPRDVQRRLNALRNDNRRAERGKDYWTASIRAMGVQESTSEGILRVGNQRDGAASNSSNGSGRFVS
jgi:hypothetical protein